MHGHAPSDAGRGHRAIPADDDRATLRRALRPRGPVQLALTKRMVGDATIIEVGGELDVLTTSRLGAEIDQIVRRHAGDLVLDLRSTGFVDSAGLYLLLSTQRRLARQQRALAVVCDPGSVELAIARARLLDALGVVSSVDDALAAAVQANRQCLVKSRGFADGH